MSMKIATAAAAAVSTLVLIIPATASAQRGRPELPRGSYVQSCTDISMRGGRLYAECTDTRRNRLATSIDASACRGDIGNVNGLLTCNGATGRFEGRDNNGGWNGGGNHGGNQGGWNGGNHGGNDGGWGGGRNASITVYRDANFRGPSQTYDGEISNLGRSGFNDAISSMRMRGRWQACEDANFRGQCFEFDGEVANLSRYRLNDRISSLRPVRGGGRW